MSNARDADLPFPLVRLPESTRAARHPRIPRKLLRIGARHPEWWILLVSASAWAWIFFAPRTDHDTSNGIVAATLAIGTMVTAMMLPLCIGHARALARSAPRRDRQRRAVAFVSGYLALWVMAMAVLHVIWSVSASLAEPVTAAGIVVVTAALWEMAPVKRRLEHACAAAPPVARPGWGAGLTCGMKGMRVGTRCVGSCWALMVACAALAHSFWAMAILFAVQLSGRYLQRIPPFVAAAAVVAAWFVAIGSGFDSGHHH